MHGFELKAHGFHGLQGGREFGPEMEPQSEAYPGDPEIELIRHCLELLLWCAPACLLFQYLPMLWAFQPCSYPAFLRCAARYVVILGGLTGA